MPEIIAAAAHPIDDAAFMALTRCLRIEREQMREAGRDERQLQRADDARHRCPLIMGQQASHVGGP